MDLKALEKPLASIENILSHFPVNQPCLIETGQTLPTAARNGAPPGKIVFLLSGAMICALGEGDKKQNLAIVTGPSILGLGQLAPSGAIAQYEAIAPCMVYSVGVDKFIKIVEENRLWPDVMKIILTIVNTLAARTAASGLQSAYDIIRSYLIYMDRETAYSLKERYTVVKYMQTFSRLSRSIILKILAELKAGGFIEMKKGKLIRINRNLPEKF
ncbi:MULTISPECIES: helix-turn-helix domain-containing protein [Enterobacteriaceae]|jgi:CRP-like cAMP-binding protein|uniref:helix-turn-helix domain-containing protein n=1 Tax=Enterobacteriaceae TaxID=543 RepID=UPI000E8AF289|nr:MULTISPECIES: helix-turn-helix domain-containing protein [Enterobacteriaceae]MCR4458461.1 helix-turn-helix domain-containing protein [Pseudescherichia sp. L3]WPO96255.1 helix-turn-helix domain-containing protein [Buttiauxella sp. HR94]HAZ77817.1 hypothetical protein [Enterobacteriaceae bacterium]